MTEITPLTRVFDAIDHVNSEDPTMETGCDGHPTPAALLYGQRMHSELMRVVPKAPDLLRIAARGQHIARWKRPRTDYPEGRTGYLNWRRDLGEYHATRVGAIMAHEGYTPEEVERVGVMLRKEGIKRDPDVQQLEDIICLVFLRWYFEPFAAKHPKDAVLRIIEKTARKMSPECRERVLREFDLPPNLQAAVAG